MSSEESTPFLCVICCEDSVDACVGECGHRCVCVKDGLRLRALFDDNRCPLCKAESEKVVYTTDLVSSFSDLSSATASRVYAPDLNAWFDGPEQAKEARLLLALRCPVCVQEGGPKARQTFRDVHSVKRHVSSAHRLLVCDTCWKGWKVFPCDQLVYTGAELATHMKEGDKRHAMEPHVRCEWCRGTPPFFSEVEVLEHKRETHFFCQLCEIPADPRRFFKNMNGLNRHYRSRHYPCDLGDCQDMGVVFRSEMDLQGHYLTEHADTKGMSQAQRRRAQRLDLGFTVGSSSRGPGRRGGDRGDRGGGGGGGGGGRRRDRGSGAGAGAGTGSGAVDDRGLTMDDAMTSAKAEADMLFQAAMAGGVMTSSHEQLRRQNIAVMTAMRSALDKSSSDGDDSETRFTEFRTLSSRFRKGTIGPGEYHRLFQDIFGVEDAKQLFPRLVALLPDAAKRAELREVYISAARANAASDWMMHFTRAGAAAAAKASAEGRSGAGTGRSSGGKTSTGGRGGGSGGGGGGGVVVRRPAAASASAAAPAPATISVTVSAPARSSETTAAAPAPSVDSSSSAVPSPAPAPTPAPASASASASAPASTASVPPSAPAAPPPGLSKQPPGLPKQPPGLPRPPPGLGAPALSSSTTPAAASSSSPSTFPDDTFWAQPEVAQWTAIQAGHATLAKLVRSVFFRLINESSDPSEYALQADADSKIQSYVSKCQPQGMFRFAWLIGLGLQAEAVPIVTACMANAVEAGEDPPSEAKAAIKAKLNELAPLDVNLLQCLLIVAESELEDHIKRSGKPARGGRRRGRRGDNAASSSAAAAARAAPKGWRVPKPAPRQAPLPPPSADDFLFGEEFPDPSAPTKSSWLARTNGTVALESHAFPTLHAAAAPSGGTASGGGGGGSGRGGGGGGGSGESRSVSSTPAPGPASSGAAPASAETAGGPASDLIAIPRSKSEPADSWAAPADGGGRRNRKNKKQNKKGRVIFSTGR